LQVPASAESGPSISGGAKIRMTYCGFALCGNNPNPGHSSARSVPGNACSPGFNRREIPHFVRNDDRWHFFRKLFRRPVGLQVSAETFEIVLIWKTLERFGFLGGPSFSSDIRLRVSGASAPKASVANAALAQRWLSDPQVGPLRRLGTNATDSKLGRHRTCSPLKFFASVKSKPDGQECLSY